MADTLGLLQEALQLAGDLGSRGRAEPRGAQPGGPCTVGGAPHVLLNLEHPVAARLDVLVKALAVDPRVAAEPKSRLLAARLAASAPPG
ncbi:MAG: hypothetical protein ACKONH_05375 [Planctomycetia bacterium]